MRLLLRMTLVALLCVGVAVGVVLALVGPVHEAKPDRGRTNRTRPPGKATESGPKLPLISEEFLDDSGYALAYPYTAAIQDRRSLSESLEACRARVRRGLADQQAKLEELDARGGTSPLDAIEKSRLQTNMALLYMYDGRFREADPWIERAIASARSPGVPRDLATNLIALRAIAALRQGELDNCIACLGPSSCILPIAPQAVHLNQKGSRVAFGYFSEYLKERPEDLGARWLLNIAAMTLGEYPDRVPDPYRISFESLGSKRDVGQFINIAPLVGLDARGPNMSGGSIFDDFNGDGLADILTTTTDWDAGASLFLSRGDGTFEDRSTSSGLDAQPMALNVAHADYDNDGLLDVVLLRGGWEDPFPLSLLHNVGDGQFEDVTEASGLGIPIASQAAAWGDFDNDGDVDLYVCGEYAPIPQGRVPEGDIVSEGADPRNRCRLYRNNGDGTFTDIAEEAGVRNERWAKGAAWGDYDRDGHLDLYVSNYRGPNRLYHNEGDGTFVDRAPELGLTEPSVGFACWFWDYDNDGWLDIYVNAFDANLQEFVSDVEGRPAPSAARPRLYRNLGPEGFRDVTTEAGLDHVWMPMGASFGDIDNDGYDDIYLGTGRPHYSHLVPNVLLKNVEGRRFEDVTYTSGTGHLQKGHGVSFADWDHDGDLDLFIEVGGATPGDKGHNALFQNPGHGRHWLRVKLVGDPTNRAGLGSTVRVDIPASGGRQSRSLVRQIGGGSSFGGNELAAWFGLGDSVEPVTVTVSWPASKTTQTFHNVPVDHAIVVKEGAESYQTLEWKSLPRPTLDMATRPVKP